MTISLPSDIISKFNEGIDAILTAFAVPCILYYAPKITSCPNCYIDPNTGVSSGRYKSGGPIPFTTGNICPYCGGRGHIEDNIEETLNMCVYYTAKDFKKIVPNVEIEIPAGAILTKFYTSDYPKVQKAVQLSVNSNISNIVDYRFKRYKEVIPSGFKGERYMLQFWERA